MAQWSGQHKPSLISEEELWCGGAESSRLKNPDTGTLLSDSRVMDRHMQTRMGAKKDGYEYIVPTKVGLRNSKEKDPTFHCHHLW